MNFSKHLPVLRNCSIKAETVEQKPICVKKKLTPGLTPMKDSNERWRFFFVMSDLNEPAQKSVVSQCNLSSSLFALSSEMWNHTAQ